MAAILEPLLMAAIAFSLGMAVTSLLPNARGQSEIEARIFFRLMLGPVCLAVLILVLDGVAGRLYGVW
jgi:hypothetical protein